MKQAYLHEMFPAEGESVPKRRFEGFTARWKQYSLEDLANIVRGASPRPIQDPKWFDKKSDVGWLRIRDVTEQNGRIHYLEQRISELGQQKTRVIREPHLLLSIAATVGKPVVNYVKTGVHDGFLIFYEPKFILEFMYQWLEMFRPMWQRYGQPGSQVNLNTDLVKHQKVHLPTIEEQQKIGSFFEMIDENVTLEESKLNKLTSIKQAYLHEMFPAEGESVPKRRFEGFTGEWKEQKLGELGWFGRTYTFSRASEGQGDCYHIHYGDIHAKFKGLITKSTRIPSIKTTGSYEFLSDGDIVIADASEDYIDLGKTVVIDDVNNRKIVAGLHTFKFTPNEKLDSVFYLYFSQTDLFKNFTARAGTGISVFGLSKESLFNMKFYLPSTEEQQKIGSFFRKLDERIALQQVKINKLKAMKQAYLHEMFV